MSSPIVVRFPPSPTGSMHIGNARTGYFTWLYARHVGGKFLVRIEDTDRERSTPASIKTIMDGMAWLGMDWDNNDPALYNGRNYYSQFENAPRHLAVAQDLLAQGKAYYCYATPEELAAMRAEQKAKGQNQGYDGRWRDRPASEAPAGVKPAIRLKVPREGATMVDDIIKGSSTVQNTDLDDLVLVRSDGVPTYMLAVVVDDHDMGVTHVTRGDDHFTNTFRQIQIYKACGWDVPQFAHFPMILGPDGAKLGKRHGATSLTEYQEQGYLPEALKNYILRLCWSHGDDEIISEKQAIEWFDLSGVGKSPAKFDYIKLNSVNAHYIQQADDARLASLTKPFLEKLLGRAVTEAEIALLVRAMPDLKPRAQRLDEIANASAFMFRARPMAMEEKAQKILTPEAKVILKELAEKIKTLPEFSGEAVEALFRAYAEEKGMKLGGVAQPLRAALSGSNVSPPIFTVADILGREETLARIADAV